MSLLKKLAGLAVGAATVGAAVYVLQNREHHDDEYEHIWGPEDEVEPETDSAEPTRPRLISYAVFCLKKSKDSRIVSFNKVVGVSNIGYTSTPERKSREGWRFAKQIRPDLD